jgi:hypothetical protein
MVRVMLWLRWYVITKYLCSILQIYQSFKSSFNIRADWCKYVGLFSGRLVELFGSA